MKDNHIKVPKKTKEIKFRPKSDEGYRTKVAHIKRFLIQGDQVKVTVMFRGREISHPELGVRIFTKIATEVADIATAEWGHSSPNGP